MNELTPREWQVLCMIADGLTNAQIAAEFNVNIRTVESHRLNARQKLYLHSRADIVAWVRQQQQFIAAEIEADNTEPAVVEPENIVAIATVPVGYFAENVI